jgi:flagellar basal-body rod protein FlgF
MKSGPGWNAAVPWAALVVGGLLGWAGGVWSGPRDAALTLPLLDVAAAPPSRISSPSSDSFPSGTDSSPRPDAELPRSVATPASNAGSAVRAVIDRELPHATPDERDIWFEQLRELPPGIVEDLLNVRKQFRQMVPPLSPSLTPAPLTFSPPAHMPLPRATDPAWQASRESLERVRQITLHNLANANTPGFRRVEPLLEAVADQHGSQLTGTRLDLRTGPIRPTNRLADVALDGTGWFAVEVGESLMVTRRGAFVVWNGRLALPVNSGQFAPVVPPIVVREGFQRIDISGTGEVGGWTADAALPQSLGQLKIALLSDAGLAALEAGQPIPRDAVSVHPPGTVGTSPLVTRSLELSNVDIDEERVRLRWIDECLGHITPVTDALASPGIPFR